MKKILLVCIAILASISTAFAYKIGDIIEVAGAKGVVFEITSDGQHGKVISVTDGECNWEAAKQWCVSYGKGWRMPSKDELSKIKDAPYRINNSLEEKGYAIMMFSYLSSTEAGSGHALYVDIFSGDIDYDAKSKNHYVRAVCSF